jgi:hypothetical protein
MELLREIHKSGKETLRGSATRNFVFNDSVALPHPVQVRSAKVERNHVCLWVSFTDSLWGYLDLSYLSTRIAFFDASKAGMTLNNCDSFRFADVQKYVTAIMDYREGPGWRRM